MNKHASSTKTLILYWIYVDYSMVSYPYFEMTMNWYWRRHAGLPMANSWWNVKFYI